MDPLTMLTVMPDFGWGSFLWIRRPEFDEGGVGLNCCDAFGKCDSHPMSEALWQDFVQWALEFEHADWREDGSSLALDWDAFHVTGLALARRLKAEVGDGFRVIYVKPAEDPERALQERREVMADGSLIGLRTMREEAMARLHGRGGG